jgi:hypothetical protein
MTCPTVGRLLLPNAQRDLAAAFGRYPHLYDQVLEEVHARLNTAGYATKLDLAALITWKHIQTAPWMQKLLKQPPMAVQQRTQAAFAPGISDQQRIDALESIPGLGGVGRAFTSVLLAAWRPTEYGVYDDRASGTGWVQVVDPQCACNRHELPVYFDHLRQMAGELRGGWTPRNVDMALYSLLHAARRSLAPLPGTRQRPLEGTTPQQARPRSISDSTSTPRAVAPPSGTCSPRSRLRKASGSPLNDDRCRDFHEIGARSQIRDVTAPVRRR